MAYHSDLFDIDVRDEIAREFTDGTGKVDDMMAGLHEVRERLAEERAREAPATARQQPAP